LLTGWDDLVAREVEVGVQAGDPIFLAPDYRVDPVLALYGQSTTFRRYTAETRRNYATDICLLLTFLSGVNGHFDLRVGGQVISGLVDCGSRC
jgi:hypothetical protein